VRRGVRSWGKKDEKKKISGERKLHKVKDVRSRGSLLVIEARLERLLAVRERGGTIATRREKELKAVRLP